MDLEEKLKLLKKTRDNQAKSRPPARSPIEKIWSEIDSDAELSVKQKLEKLISLTGKTWPKGRGYNPEEEFKTSQEAVQIFENAYSLNSRYGQIPISLGLQIPGRILTCLSRDKAFESLDLSTAAFLDLETTGLAGGTGTVPFLIGFGYYHENKFKITQFFLNDLAEEQLLIKKIRDFFYEMNFRSVVTYNGKAYDIPLLETRFALCRSSFPLSSLPHLDFLLAARLLWKKKYESCRLFSLAQQLIQATRDEDIPGSEIPIRFFHYLRSRDFSLVEPILNHNLEDLLSLLGVVVAGAVLMDRKNIVPHLHQVDTSELYGVARLYELAGEIDESIALLEQTVFLNENENITQLARKKLTEHFKRNQVWNKALRIWQLRANCNDVYCLCELAKYYEHKEKNYEMALQFSEQGFELVRGKTEAGRHDFEKRIARLKKKLSKKNSRLTEV